MRKTDRYQLLCFILMGLSVMSCETKNKEQKENNPTTQNNVWEVDFLDEFDTFNPDNWQDQRIWVNNETHCYVPNGEFGTREVGDGTLKLKVVKIDLLLVP